MTESQEFLVDRTVVIRAKRNTVFRYFTDSTRFAEWWGPGSSIDGKPGGRIHIAYPDGTTAGGTVIEVVPDQRIVFSYGYDDPAKPIARGATRVSVTLEDHEQGTLLRLVHALPDRATRDAHGPGWRFQLSLFANVASRRPITDIAAFADRWFAVWAEPNAGARARSLGDLVTEDVEFRDAYAAIRGRDDLADHIAASQMHMPGVHVRRHGEPHACQGMSIVDWVAVRPDGDPIGRGTNVFEFAPDGRIASCVGFWLG